jgi:hypothetical protein
MRYLTEKYAKKPVIVMNYPKAIKAFYMRVSVSSPIASLRIASRGGGWCCGRNAGTNDVLPLRTLNFFRCSRRRGYSP